MTTDDLLEIPAFLRRTRTATPATSIPPKQPKAGWIMPGVKEKTRKRPGQTKALRALGWRPRDIKKLTRREADEAVALRRAP
jgi:hypothetical protein